MPSINDSCVLVSETVIRDQESSDPPVYWIGIKDFQAKPLFLSAMKTLQPLAGGTSVSCHSKAWMGINIELGIGTKIRPR